MDYIFLQQYWWILISLLGALLVFLLFVQGGQTLLNTIGKTEMEKTMLINAIGRKWEFTFTTLVTFGGAFFASFPLFYSTSFGGAYWLWMVLLFCFIIQAVSYQFRSKKGNILGKKTYDIFLLINGFGGTLLLGTAVATFFTGSDFLVNRDNLTNLTNPVISKWMNPLYGLEALLNSQNLMLGLAVFFLSRVTASLYFLNSIEDENISNRSRKQVLFNFVPFLVFFLGFVIWTFFGQGFSVNPENQEVYRASGKYFLNLMEMPVVLVLFLAGVCSLLFGVIKTLLKPKYRKGVWFAGSGVVATVLALFLVAGLNNTSYYPSNFDLKSSLTIYNSSSSYFTLKVMSVVSLIIPFVVLYIFWVWRMINKKDINQAEMESGDHTY